jgi:hypothetical protein
MSECGTRQIKEVIGNHRTIEWPDVLEKGRDLRRHLGMVSEASVRPITGK